MRSARFAWIAALAAAASLRATPTHGAPSPQEQAAAVRLSSQAQEAFRRREYAEAADAYRRADQLSPSPQTKLDLARALVGSGRLLEASMILSAVAETEGTTPGAKRAQRTARRLLAKLDPRIPSLQVTVEGLEPEAVRTVVDGQEFSVTSEVPLDPGEHSILVEAPGFEPAETRVMLAERAREKLTIVLTPMKKPAPANAAPAARAAPASGGSKVPAAVAFGVGALGLSVGTAFGLAALGETSTAKESCQANVCPNTPDVVDARDAALLYGNISTAAFIAGGAGVAAGIVLLLVSPGASKPEAMDRSAVQPWVGLGGAGVTGVF